MDSDPYHIRTNPNLLDVQETTPSRFDYSPAVWQAAEALIAPDLVSRQVGLDRLIEYQAASANPLVAYVLATRLAEPDLRLRTRVVESLACLLNGNDPGDQGKNGNGKNGNGNGENGHNHHPGASQALVDFLALMRTRQVYSLLQVGNFDPAAKPLVGRLLSFNSFAGNHLAEIFADRQAPLTLRKLAVYYTGQIGYLDALPTLERLAARLEVRKNGNGFANPDEDETALLPLIHEALDLLRLP
jgi:hypothetical protein